MFAVQKDVFCLGPNARMIFAHGKNKRDKGGSAGNTPKPKKQDTPKKPKTQPTENVQAVDKTPQKLPAPTAAPEQLDQNIHQETRDKITKALDGGNKTMRLLGQYSVNDNAEKIEESREKVDAAIAEIQKSRTRLNELPGKIQKAFQDVSKNLPSDSKLKDAIEKHFIEYSSKGPRKNLAAKVQELAKSGNPQFTKAEATEFIQAYDEGPESYQKLLNEYFDQHRFGNPEDFTVPNEKAEVARNIDDLKKNLLILTPKAHDKIEQEFQEIVNTASATPDGEIAATKLQNLLNEETQLIKTIDQETQKINEEAEKLTELAAEAFEEVHARTKAEARLIAVQRHTGLPITQLTKEYPGGKTIHGEEIIFEMPERRYSEVLKAYELVGKRTLKISKVRFAPLEESVDGAKVNFPSLTPVFHVQWQNMPAININGWGASGEREMTDSQLREYLLEKEGTQVIDSVKTLAKNLHIAPEKIQKGQKFEYQQKILTIEDVNLEKGTITLDGEVTIDPESQYATSELNKPKKELTFAEFSKFYLKNDLLPELGNLKELNDALVHHNAKLNHELERKPELFPTIYLLPNKNGKIEPPLVVMNNQNPPEVFLVNGIENNKITFANPAIQPKSFNEFLRWVKDTGIEIGDPDVRALRGQELSVPENATAEQRAAAAAAEKRAAEEQQAEAEKLAKENAEKKAAGEVIVAPTATQSTPRASYSRQLWSATAFLSMNNMKGIFTKVFELSKGWFDQQNDMRSASGGAALTRNLPFGLGAFYGSNFLSQQNAAAGKAVQTLLDQWANLDPGYIIGKLFGPPGAKNLIELKAGLQKVSEYGIIRWHEKRLHNVLNRLIVKYWPPNHPLAGKRIVIPYPVENTEKNLFYQDYIRAMLDLQYSSGTYDNLFGANKGNYEKSKSGSQSNASFIEQSRPGGIVRQMQTVLQRHKKGAIGANASEYDGLLAALIAEGRSTMEQKAFFLIAGFATCNDDGYPLLDPDRLADYLPLFPTFPFIAYFGGPFHPQYEEINGKFEPVWERAENGAVIYEDGKPRHKIGNYKLNNFKKLYSEICSKDVQRKITESKGEIQPGDPKSFAGGKNTLNWIQTEVLLDPGYQQRIGKTSSSAKYDVDDYHVFGPSVRQDDMKNIISKGYGGDASVERVKNMYPGFNNQLLLLIKEKYAKENDPGKKTYILAAIIERMRSFTWMDGVVDGRYYNSVQRNPNYVRMSINDFNTIAGVDDSKEVVGFALELRAFMVEICKGLDIITKEDEPNDEVRQRKNVEFVDEIFHGKADIYDTNNYQSANAKFEEFTLLLQDALIRKREENPQEFDKLLVNATDKLSGSEARSLSPEEKAAAAVRPKVTLTANTDSEAIRRAKAARKNNANVKQPQAQEEQDEFGNII